MRSPRRGEIFRLKSDDVGKPRPVLVVSRTALNGGYYCVCVPLYGEQIERRSAFPSCVLFQEGEYGLTKTCVAKTDEISKYKVVDLRVSEGPVGTVDSQRMADVERAISYSLQIEPQREPGAIPPVSSNAN
jgi:mRNA-degrading endonuclease toxin of MazEF toxin-antitoxin module